MHVLLNHVTTPLFFSAQLRDWKVAFGPNTYTMDFDTSVECHGSGTCCHTENYNTAMFGDCTAPNHPPTYYQWPAELSGDDLAIRVSMTARGLNEFRATASELRPGCDSGPCDPSPLSPVPHAFFLDDTATHEGPENLDKVAGHCIDGVQLEDFFVHWLETGSEVMCVDLSGDEGPQGTSAPWGNCPAASVPSDGC